MHRGVGVLERSPRPPIDDLEAQAEAFFDRGVPPGRPRRHHRLQERIRCDGRVGHPQGIAGVGGRLSAHPAQLPRQIEVHRAAEASLEGAATRFVGAGGVVAAAGGLDEGVEPAAGQHGPTGRLESIAMAREPAHARSQSRTYPPIPALIGQLEAIAVDREPTPLVAPDDLGDQGHLDPMDHLVAVGPPSPGVGEGCVEGLGLVGGLGAVGPLEAPPQGPAPGSADHRRHGAIGGDTSTPRGSDPKGSTGSSEAGPSIRHATNDQLPTRLTTQGPTWRGTPPAPAGAGRCARRAPP